MSSCYSAQDLAATRFQLYKPDDVPSVISECIGSRSWGGLCDESRFELFYQPLVPIGSAHGPGVHHARARARAFDLMPPLRDESGAPVYAG